MGDDPEVRLPGTPAAPRRALRRRGEAPTWLAVLVNVLVALVLVSLVQAFLVRVHNVSSGSMLQTLQVGDRVLSSPLPLLGRGPGRGDIIIFGHGATWDDDRLPPEGNPLIAGLRTFGDLTGIGISHRTYTVKRVIGVPGDEVACCDDLGRVTVDGEPLDEPYLYEDLPFTLGGLDCASSPSSARCFRAVRVPEASYLVMGDHRSNSADSVAGCRGTSVAPTCARFVPAERVTGKVIARAFPPGPVG